jgi:hypothetical protein
LQQELIILRDGFQTALLEDDVSGLPRLIGLQKKLQCKRCPFLTKCYQDPESIEAMRLAAESTALDRNGSGIFEQYD